jgi:type IV pilus assembly protein PilE
MNGILKMKETKGFTLIELMIVVAIIGIIAAIGYPSYQESTAKARRGVAQGAMMGLSSALERYYTQENHYSDAAAASADTGAPAADLYSFETSVSDFYTITISKTDGGTSDTATAQTYELSAVPKAGMTGDRCGTMMLNSAGVKTADEPDCWR